MQANMYPGSSDCFRPADAIECMHAAILRVDTLARLAERAVDELRCPLAPEAEREFSRLQILVAKTAEEASTALAESDRLMAALLRHLTALRSSDRATLR